MRTKLKKLTSVCLAVIMLLSVLTVAPVTVNAAVDNSESVSATSGDFEYEVLDDGKASIIGYNGSATELEIPSTLDGYTVTGIAGYAFMECKSLIKITIPKSVTLVGYRVFEGCTNLANIIVPDCITEFGTDVFKDTEWYDNQPNGVVYIGNILYGYKGNMPENTTIKVKDNIKVIAAGAFFKCANLKAIELPNSIKFMGEGVFNNCKNLINIKIPNGVKSIGVGSFLGCESLLNVEIPQGVTRIGQGAFENCKGFTSITIPNSCTYIENSAFLNCINLKSVIIPDSVTMMGGYVFGYIDSNGERKKIDDLKIYGYINSYAETYANKNGFTFIAIDQNASDFEYEVLDDGTASITDYTGSATELTIPSEIDGYVVSVIGMSAFYNCINLTSVTIPNSVTKIENSAFWNCTDLTSIAIPESVTEIGSSAFLNCNNLKDITLPDSITKIGSEAFYNTAWYNDQTEGVVYAGKVAYDYKGEMPENTLIILKNGTKGIAESAFENCTNLISITIPNGVTNIGYNAFAWCESLVSVVLPNSVTQIDDCAFACCKNLIDINIPNSVTRLGSGALQATNITSIEIPNSITEIENVLFADCTNLTNIVLSDSITKIGVQAFQGCKNLKSMDIPSSVKEIEAYAFDRCTSLSNITIPNSVESIGGFAFCCCNNLKEIAIPKSVNQIGEFALGYDNLHGEDKLFEPAKIDGFTIKGYKNTVAETYANENGFTFIVLDSLQAGDVNGDGNISIDDVTDIQKYLATIVDFTNEQVSLADVDKDGKVSIDDVTLIQKYLAGIATI